MSDNEIYIFERASKKDVQEMLNWKFNGIYSFYNNDKTPEKSEWISNLDRDESAFVIRNNRGELVANCCFTYDNDEKTYLFGIQLKPELTGKGLGRSIVEQSLKFGKSMFQFESIDLLVADFNKRAIKLYTNLEFTIIEEFDANSNGENVHFLVMRKYL